VDFLGQRSAIPSAINTQGADDDTSLIQLSARLPAQDRDLTAAIIQQVESEAIHVANQ
jgi:hypothetical protein